MLLELAIYMAELCTTLLAENDEYEMLYDDWENEE
jgi:hypothetical protein